jgi:hypothetical protein
MEASSELRPVNDRQGSTTTGLASKVALPREKPLATVGGFTLSNFDVVAIAASVLMVCGPLLGAVIRVG